MTIWQKLQEKNSDISEKTPHPWPVAGVVLFGLLPESFFSFLSGRPSAKTSDGLNVLGFLAKPATLIPLIFQLPFTGAVNVT